MHSKSSARPSQPSPNPVKDAANALYRAAKECCHQHERIGGLNSVSADDQEFAAVWQMADLAEAHMVARTMAYEAAAAEGRGMESEDWWHRANALWMACREYARRYAASADAASRRKRHTAAELSEIAVEYELEHSARVAVRIALSEYSAVQA